MGSGFVRVSALAPRIRWVLVEMHYTLQSLLAVGLLSSWLIVRYVCPHSVCCKLAVNLRIVLHFGHSESIDCALFAS